ncbi:hypothetical protein HaLaN_27129 [Haematococcus lacustris]|uniref:Uncharacterized protein n=1 Tax=Haematococcus lacustris TaxID=44745 RepID=A0A6A0A7I2_HAELA|nr:hypothetical protein HaLaN_27129 [Haematococcus lacustris]
MAGCSLCSLQSGQTLLASCGLRMLQPSPHDTHSQHTAVTGNVFQHNRTCVWLVSTPPCACCQHSNPSWPCSGESILFHRQHQSPLRVHRDAKG